MRSFFSPAIYFILDPACCRGRDVLDVALAAARGGVTMLQLRNKSGNMPEFLAQAALLSEILKPFNIPFFVNDSIDVAFAVGADGVHLGQGDESVVIARKRLGDGAIIGQTAFTPAHMAVLDPAVVDYIGTGPIFPTQTDKGKPVLGMEGFRDLVALSPVPVVGIGGITAENAPSVMSCGAAGVAMMRAISEAEDVEGAARHFRKVLGL